jgi:hypothetical protein
MKMKKKIYFKSAILMSAALLLLSGCLKDKFIDFSKNAPVVDFPLGGLTFFGADAVTETPDTDANGTIVRQFAINVGSPQKLTTATTVKLAVDNSIITTYNAANPAVTFLPMPANAFSFTSTSVNVPAGQQYVTISVTFYKNKLDPTLSYMLPIKIVSAGGITVSGNMGIHYYHFIGNDFAGAYLATFVRVPAGGDYANAPVTLVPKTPTEFDAPGGYVGARYDVTFTKTGTGPTATYSDFTVVIDPADVTGIFNPAPAITVTSPPVIVGYDPNHQYTYNEVVHGLLKFTYTVVNGSGNQRVNTDTFIKP